MRFLVTLLVGTLLSGGAYAGKADRKTVEVDMLRAIEMAASKAGELDALQGHCRRGPRDAGLRKIKQAIRGTRNAEILDVQERAYRYGQSLIVRTECTADAAKTLQEGIDRNLGTFARLRKRLGI